MEKLYLRLEGKTSLLMNNPEKTLGGEGKTRGIGEKLPAPDEQAALRRYLLPNNTLYVPATAVRKCLLIASKGYTTKVGGRGRAQAVQPVLSSALVLTDPAFPLLDENNKPIQGDNYKVNVQRIVIGQSSIWRGRPEVFPWRLVAWFLYDSRRIDLELVKTLAGEAGRYPGLLDYRPEKGGWFGTFEAKDIWAE